MNLIGKCYHNILCNFASQVNVSCCKILIYIV